MAPTKKDQSYFGRGGLNLYTFALPGPQKYVEYWPFKLVLVLLDHYFTHFGDQGNPSTESPIFNHPPHVLELFGTRFWHETTCANAPQDDAAAGLLEETSRIWQAYSRNIRIYSQCIPTSGPAIAAVLVP